MDQRKIISSIPIFSSLPDSDIGAIVEIARTKRVAARKTLFRKGDEGGQLYAVVSGRLKAVSHADDGRELVFAILDAGDVFGEIALVDRKQRSATVIAIEPSVLVVIHRRDLLPLVQRNPQLAMNLMAFLGERLRKVSALAEDAMFLTIPARLAKRLLALSRLYGAQTGDGIRIDLKLTQQELGELVGATRESVNKQLRQWAQEGVIRVDAGHITILGEESLETLAALVTI